MRKIAVLVVVAILFRRHASGKFQEAISWSITWTFLLHCLSLKYVVSDHFRWSNVPVHQNKLKMCLYFDQIRTWQRCLKLAFFGLYINVVFGNCSIRLSNDWNNFYETTDHLQKLRADKFSTFFKSEAFTFSSANLIEFIWPGLAQWWQRSPSTHMARVRFSDLPSHVDWVCWFSTLLWDVFPGATPVFPFHWKPTFDLICCDSVWFVVSLIRKASVLG